MDEISVECGMHFLKSLPYSHEFGHILETCQRASLTAEPVIFV